MGFVVFSAISPVLGQFPAITESPDWRNTITFERDSFYARSLSSNSPTWIKFMILLEPYDSNLVYFQNSRRYVFHYEAANALIEPFKEMSAQQFNEVSLFEENQQVILGTVIVPPISFDTREPLFAEYGIQFVRQDPYPKEQLHNLFNLVKDNVLTSSHVQAFYFPTFEQEEVTQDHAEWFESQGIALGSTARWVTGNTCYSKGWASLQTVSTLPIAITSLNQLTFYSQTVFLRNCLISPASYHWSLLLLIPMWSYWLAHTAFHLFI